MRIFFIKSVRKSRKWTIFLIKECTKEQQVNGGEWCPKAQHFTLLPKFRTLILMHLKEIELCYKIFLGSRCILFIRSIHCNKFGQRKSRKFKIFILLILGQYGGVLLVFTKCLYLIVTRLLELHFYGKEVGKKIQKPDSSAFFISTFQEKIRWSATNSFSAFERCSAVL